MATKKGHRRPDRKNRKLPFGPRRDFSQRVDRRNKLRETFLCVVAKIDAFPELPHSAFPFLVEAEAYMASYGRLGLTEACLDLWVGAGLPWELFDEALRVFEQRLNTVEFVKYRAA